MLHLLLLLLSPLLAYASTLSPQTLTLSLRPDTTAANHPYLDIHYDPSSRTASILKRHPLPSLPPSTPLIPLGFTRPDLPASQAWTSISIPPSALSPSRDRVVELLLDREGRPYTVGFTSVPVTPAVSEVGPGKGGQTQGRKKEAEVVEGGITVRVVPAREGPGPALNRPVVVGKDGRVEGAEPEKSFLQKYWWMIAIFLVIQVVAGGGKE
ncbi:hypothetical protein B9Z65_6795 [Elsinoe australis]|uniref:ER membrane protein complex subunit 10 n=1 Tax=Elsinoe australis TaxID=40998 RepID=A0A2P8AEA8_9PEZI|nr:hypothetical protein B9Z65_6795 [Elsinoe australis]